MVSSRVWLGAFLVSALALLGGCRQSVFVGFPTPTPAASEQWVALPAGDAPAPPVAAAVANPLEALASRPLTASARAPGPAFNWSTTDNFLVLGTDRRSEKDSWRTDSIMIVGIDRANQRAAVLSVPRDLYVEIPNYRFDRINQVDYVGEQVLKVDGGGPALVSEVLSRTLGIATGHWVRVEMTGFQSLVDAVGGVTIHLDCPFYEPIFNLETQAWEYFTLPAGDVTMDGETAYWFVRLRLRESDIGRAQRQRLFLWALREQALRTNLILRFPELYSAFRETFSTDLNLIEMIDMAQFALSLDADNVRASGITLADLQQARTDGGAAVLMINDPQRVRSVVEGIWDAPAMAEAYRQDSTRCAPIPTYAPNIATDTAAPAVAPADATGAPAAPTPVPAEEQPTEPIIIIGEAGNPPPPAGGAPDGGS
jgi:LCP family protein required for cell wall assembly